MKVGRMSVSAVWFALAFSCGVIAGGQGALAQDTVVPDSREQIRLSYAPVVKSVAPAVVNISTSRTVRRANHPFFDDPFFRRFFGNRAPGGGGGGGERVQNSLGSGVIVDPSGLVITNAHVIEGADEIRVAFADRREFRAEIVTTDESTDLAVLKIDAEGPFASLEFSDSDLLEVGDIVLAIGNPFGVGQTVTSGIVSAVARTQVGIADFGFFVQTDAAINPGNSGGALVDMRGRLVGINTAIFSRSGGSHGIGFAIPANMVRLVATSAQEGGQVRRPWFGGSMQAVTPDIAESLGMSRPVGVLVGTLHPNGPAAGGGLRTGDVVTSVDGYEVSDPGAFRYRFTTRGIGGSVDVTAVRGGEERQLTVALVSPPEEPPRELRSLDGPSPFAGARIGNLSPALAEELSLDMQLEGVAIVEIERNSPAHQVGLKPGDIIREVNGVVVDSTRRLEAIARERAPVWRLAIERDGRVISTALRG